MSVQGGDAGPNYIVPSDSAGRGTSVATFTEGNIVHVSEFKKGVDNDIRGYFARPISIKTGDVVNIKTTRKTGTFSGTVTTYAYLGTFNLTSSGSISWSTTVDINVTATADANYTAEYVRFRNGSTARTGNNDGNLIEIFINGEQVI